MSNYIHWNQVTDELHWLMIPTLNKPTQAENSTSTTTTTALTSNNNNNNNYIQQHSLETHSIQEPRRHLSSREGRLPPPTRTPQHTTGTNLHPLLQPVDASLLMNIDFTLMGSERLSVFAPCSLACNSVAVLEHPRNMDITQQLFPPAGPEPIIIAPGAISSSSNSSSSNSSSSNSSSSIRTSTKEFKRIPIPRNAKRILKNLFDIDSHPSRARIGEIATDLNLERKKVRVWFQNQRTQSKKLNNC
ncbi:hypothetical protein BDR26DRAFT_855966 [Obelidium mucronatum]|nr:hypothetical protein BDR26DRAFT_855966 [Obelidium mucronatum]